MLADQSPYEYQHTNADVLKFKKKVIRFLSEFAPQKLRASLCFVFIFVFVFVFAFAFAFVFVFVLLLACDVASTAGI